MRIKLHAFGNKLTGYMEVPENTTPKFDLVLLQPIQLFNDGFQGEDMPMNPPIHTRCTFEWTGKYEGFEENSARIYQLTNIEGIPPRNKKSNPTV